MRILLVEDDPVLADGLVRILQQSQYLVSWANNGASADQLLQLEKFDLLILDMGLPDMDGAQILRRLRARNNALSVLILTAQDSVANRVQGLDLGADDYLTKPFDVPELEARIRALLRRGQAASSTVLQLGSLLLDSVGHCASVQGVALELSARELGVLELLLRRAGRVVSKEQLGEQLPDLGEEISSNAIEVYVHRVRKKIEASQVGIRTVRGLGYLLEVTHAA
ncbi:MAG: response regulator [Gallionella sp.]